VAITNLKAGDYVVEALVDSRALKLRIKGGIVQQIPFPQLIETNRE
jgi:hypothetical protein